MQTLLSMRVTEADSVDAASTSIPKKPSSGRFFFACATGGGNRTRGTRGISGNSGSTAPRRKSALRLQAQGSPIRLTRGKSPRDFLPFRLCWNAAGPDRRGGITASHPENTLPAHRPMSF